jgi:hypothetical protein
MVLQEGWPHKEALVAGMAVLAALDWPRLVQRSREVALEVRAAVDRAGILTNTIQVVAHRCPKFLPQV